MSDPPPPRTTGRPKATADYNTRILWPLARYIEDQLGAQTLHEVSALVGIPLTDLDGRNAWVGAETFEAFLSTARARMADDEEFTKACVHRMREAYGPLRYVLWALTPGAVYSQGAKQFRLVSMCGELEIREQGRTWVQTSFRSHKAFSRLNCMVRHAQGAALPTMWGMPPAHVRETACIARGDATCELRFHWYEARRWLPVILWSVLFTAIGLALARLGMHAVPTPLAAAAVGAALGYLVEVRRAEKLNEKTREEVVGALREMAQDEGNARRELLEMHQRQKGWTRLVEEEMTLRATAIQRALAGVHEAQSARASTLLGFSHDLRNPLQIIQTSTEFLGEIPALAADQDARDSLKDIGQSVDRMRRMLGELVQVTKSQRDFVKMAPQRVETAALTDSLGRRMRALVYGREVRSTVFATREAPEAVQVDPLALDRILDNLLTNAAKYTERGSIVVELDGTPGSLVIKVSDTGCGIEPHALERIFEPGGSNPRSRRGDSFGVGLSVVVQLLDQIGGRLEVMSSPDSGTTFWVRLPLEAARGGPTSLPETPESRDVSQNSSAGPLSRVVSIRKLSA